MPDRSKLRWSQLKDGIVALAAMVIAGVLIFLLTSSKGIFHHNALLRTYMDDASGIADGSPVRLNGLTDRLSGGAAADQSRNRNRTVEFDMRVEPAFSGPDPRGFGGGYHRGQPAGRQVH